MYEIMAGRFPNPYPFQCCPERFPVYVICFRAFFESLEFFVCYLSIRPFCYVLSVPIFFSKFFCFLCIRLLILLCPVLFVLLDPVSISFKSLFSLQYLLIYHFKLYGPTCLCVFPSSVFSFVVVFFLSVLLSNFPFRFSISFRFPLGNTDFITD